MRLKLGLTKVLIFGAMGVLTLSFQNCSGVNFKSQTASSLSSKGDAGGEASGAIQQNCDEGSDCLSSEEEQQQRDWLNANCFPVLPFLGTASNDDKVIQNHNGPLLIGSVHDLQLTNIHGPVAIQSGNSLTAQSLWGPLFANFVSIPQLKDQYGASCLSAHSIAEIQNFRGASWIMGVPDANGARAEFDHIVDTRGAMWISNAHIHLLQSTRGALCLNNVDVDQIVDHDGTIAVVNGSVQSLQNVRGAVVINGQPVQ
jgi:hypothetical protein